MFKSRDALIIAAVVLFVVGLAVWGFSACSAPACKPWPQRLVGVANLFGRGGPSYSFGRDPWQLAVAQYLAPYVVPFAALFAAAKFIVGNLRRDVHVLLARFQKHHTIICGLDDTAMQIVQNFRKGGRDVVIIDNNADSPHAKTCEQQAIPVIRGSARNPRVFQLSGISRAQAVVVCTGNDVENLDVGLRIKEVAQAEERFLRGRLLVLTELRSDKLFERLIEHDKETLGSQAVDLRPFNAFENAARALVQSMRLPPAEFRAGTFVIVGFGAMGRELAMHILRAAPAPVGSVPKIVVCDRNADALGQNFIASIPPVDDLFHFEFVTVDLNSGSPTSWSPLEQRLRSEMPIGVAVCLPDDSAGLQVALEIRNRLDRLGHPAVPLFVRLARYRALGNFAGSVEKLGCFVNRFSSFGSLEDLLASEVFAASSLDVLARAYHESHVETLPDSRRNTAATRSWDELPELFKMSSRRFADHLHIKFAQSGLRMNKMSSPEILELTVSEIESMAKLEHRRWTIERRLQGWVRGETRSDTKRTHPDLVGWERLPLAVQNHNRAQMAALPAILVRAGFEVRRERIVHAYGPFLEETLSREPQPTADRRMEHLVVIADLDCDQSCELAVSSLDLPESSLWLISDDDLDELIRRSNLAPNKRALIGKATGWLRRDWLLSFHQFRSESGPSEVMDMQVTAAQ